MIEACLLPTFIKGSPSPLQVFGPWFPREGDNARFALEVAAVVGAKITVEVFHKNLDDAGDGVVYAAKTIVFDQATGLTIQEWLGLKALARFRYTLDPGADLVAGTWGWVMFRFLQPVWFETIAGPIDEVPPE